jgi:uncharacterized protein YbaR (Trm112 family)
MKRRMRARPRRRGGFYVEIAVSTLIVAALVLASLQVAGQSTLAQRLTSENATGTLLADALLCEACGESYADVDSSPVMFGPEAGESGRALFDDVDDYHLFEEAPPANRQGNVLDGMADWQRRVRVEWVDADQFSAVSVAETGVKQIIVEAFYQGRLAATVSALRVEAP